MFKNFLYNIHGTINDSNMSEENKAKLALVPSEPSEDNRVHFKMGEFLITEGKFNFKENKAVMFGFDLKSEQWMELISPIKGNEDNFIFVNYYLNDDGSKKETQCTH